MLRFQLKNLLGTRTEKILMFFSSILIRRSGYLVLFLFAYLPSLAWANGEVTEVIEQGKTIQINASPDTEIGKTFCVYHEENAISCGKVSECKEEKCVVQIVEQVEDILVGDAVRSYQENSSQSVEEKKEEQPAPVANNPIENKESNSENSQKPETRLELVKYHRKLIEKNGYSRPDYYDED